MSKYSMIIIFLFVVFAAVIWAVIGLFFWVPLLARSIAIFTFSVLAHAVVNKPTKESSRNLDRAILYYPNDFKIVFKALDFDETLEEEEIHKIDLGNGNFQYYKSVEQKTSLLESIFSSFGMVFKL